MLTAAQITIRDETDVVVSASAPASPVVDMLWMDTSVTPARLKRWNGSAWEDSLSELDELRNSISGNDLIVGTQTTTTGAWTGIANFSELKDGQQIPLFKPSRDNDEVKKE